MGLCTVGRILKNICFVFCYFNVLVLVWDILVALIAHPSIVGLVGFSIGKDI